MTIFQTTNAGHCSWQTQQRAPLPGYHHMSTGEHMRNDDQTGTHRSRCHLLCARPSTTKTTTTVIWRTSSMRPIATNLGKKCVHIEIRQERAPLRLKARKLQKYCKATSHTSRAEVIWATSAQLAFSYAGQRSAPSSSVVCETAKSAISSFA
jgi:hypothetical protein